MQCLGHSYTKTLFAVYLKFKSVGIPCGGTAQPSEQPGCLFGEGGLVCLQGCPLGQRRPGAWQTLAAPSNHSLGRGSKCYVLTACVGARWGGMSRTSRHGPVALFLQNILSDSGQKEESLGGL